MPDFLPALSSSSVSVTSLLKGLTSTLTHVNTQAASAYLAHYRETHPEATPRDVLDALERRYWILSSTGGGSVGAIAAVPAVGTALALGVSVTEMVGFLEATAFYIVARAELQGLPVDDLARRQTLILTIVLGDTGYTTLTKVAGRTGQHWGKAVTKSIPMSTIRAANSVLGRNVITKYGTKQGVIVIGRVMPFGIGALIGGTAGALSARGIMAAADKAFGDPPTDFPTSIPAPSPDAPPSPVASMAMRPLDEE